MRRLLPRQRAAEITKLREALAQARAENAALRERFAQERADTDQLAEVLDMVSAERDEARRDVEHLRNKVTQLGDRVNALAEERSRLEAALAARRAAPTPTTELLRAQETIRVLDADRAELIDLNDQLSRELASRAGTLAKPHPGAAS